MFLGWKEQVNMPLAACTKIHTIDFMFGATQVISKDLLWQIPAIYVSATIKVNQAQGEPVLKRDTAH